MRKIIVILGLIACAVSCSKKTVSSKSTPQPQTQADTKKEVPADAPKINDNNTEVIAAGRKIYITKCAKCHEAKPVENWNTTSWNNILKSMIPKARLTEEESKQVTAYVMVNAKK